MKTRLNHLKITVRLSFVCLSIFFLTINSAYPETDHLRGPAFSDPSKVQEMSDKWKNQPVRYKSNMKDMDIVIDINQQLIPYIKPMVEEYAEIKGLKIGFSEGTCGKSAGLIERKEVDIGGFCCPPGEIDRLPGLSYHTIGIIPLSIFVNPVNKIDNLTLDQIRHIFEGKIYKWSEVGGMDKPVRVVASMHCKIRPGHWRLLIKDENLFSPRMIEEGDMSDTIALVGSETASIGYETLYVSERFKHRGKVKALKINGYASSELEHTLMGRYPLYRTYNITTWEGKNTKNQHATELVDYMVKNIEKIQDKIHMIPASQLRKKGWKFRGDELIGEPDK